MDNHLHVDFASAISTFAFLYGAPSVAEIVKRLKETSAQSNGWILGIGWDFQELISHLGESAARFENGSLAVQCGLTRQVLDMEFPETPVSVIRLINQRQKRLTSHYCRFTDKFFFFFCPVWFYFIVASQIYIYSTCCHMGIINTAGLKCCQLISSSNDNTKENTILKKLIPYIERGFIDTFPDGSLTGLFYDTAALRLVSHCHYPCDCHEYHFLRLPYREDKYDDIFFLMFQICPYFFPGDRILDYLHYLSSLGLVACHPCDMKASKEYRRISEFLPLRCTYTVNIA